MPSVKVERGKEGGGSDPPKTPPSPSSFSSSSSSSSSSNAQNKHKEKYDLDIPLLKHDINFDLHTYNGELKTKKLDNWIR